jgi:hypothetical protein
MQTLNLRQADHTEDGGWLFYETDLPTDWYKVKTCLVNNRLSILYIADYGNELISTEFEALVQQYGKPDRVTWGPSYDTRALIWSEQGVLIFYNVVGDRPDGAVLLFSPIPAEYLDTSWLLASLPDGVVGEPPEDVSVAPEIMELEDPLSMLP